MSALSLRTAFAARALSCVEVVEALLAQVESVDPDLNAITAVAAERAVAEAREADRRFARGPAPRPLEGIPFLVKDLFDTEGIETAFGSPIFAGNVPGQDAEAVRRAREAGAILLGKTSTDEFAYGITSCNPHRGAVRNPWAPDRVSGGSSGGSAAAVACGLAPLALGSDTGGSIRAPAALCGVVGLKPTYDRLPRAGLFPMAASLDHVGPMARTPADAEMFLHVLAGPARQDEVPGPERLRVGICPDLNLVPLSASVRRAMAAAVAALTAVGAEMVELAFPGAPGLFPAFLTTQRAETIFTHRRAGLYPSRRDEYGSDVRHRLDVASEVTLDEYLAAQEERRRLRHSFDRLFDAADVVLTPVQSGSPVEIESEDVEETMREVVMDFTAPHNLLGVPACAVRGGFDELGIPIGVQFAARAGADSLVLSAARALFQATAGVQSPWPPVPSVAGAH